MLWWCWHAPPIGGLVSRRGNLEKSIGRGFLMNVPRVNDSDRCFKRPNRESCARENRRFQAELIAVPGCRLGTPRGVFSRPSPPSASNSAGYFELLPPAHPKARFWTSTIPALNEPRRRELPSAIELFRRQLQS